jgi:predicted RNase H-related nuclease YkuK (DUF458 family)
MPEGYNLSMKNAGLSVRTSKNSKENSHLLISGATSDKPFVSPSKGSLTMPKMVRDIAGFIDEDPSSFYSLIIGTDSQGKRANGNSEIDFVTAIIVYRKGKGARYYWRKDIYKGMMVLRDKIYTETLMSMGVAQKIVPEVRKKISPAKYDLEIHIDVGSLGPTRDMIREVVGMVSGNGFTAKTKPESWGASSVADKHA